MPERLQKILTQAGYSPHRACEDFISAGRVRVNGQIASVRIVKQMGYAEFTYQRFLHFCSYEIQSSYSKLAIVLQAN
jgi:16S rRNA U516 pseudouridylate synthase RsuA-like enzyme